jgi:hypothetical protein
MEIKGKTVNVVLDPRAYKELNRLENVIPKHLDLRNGHYTDMKRWEKRPGFLAAATVADLPEVDRDVTIFLLATEDDDFITTEISEPLEVET